MILKHEERLKKKLKSSSRRRRFLRMYEAPGMGKVRVKSKKGLISILWYLFTPFQSGEDKIRVLRTKSGSKRHECSELVWAHRNPCLDHVYAACLLHSSSV